MLCPPDELFLLAHNASSLFVLDVLVRFGELAQPCLYDGVQFFQVLVPAACSASSGRLSMNSCLLFFILRQNTTKLTKV